jgi:radical SAM-linked protein
MKNPEAVKKRPIAALIAAVAVLHIARLTLTEISLEKRPKMRRKTEAEMAKTLLRARFEKTGRAVYISHLDLMRTMSRAFRRTDIPFWYTEGFTPRVHLDFLLPLPLGVTGLNEFFDFAVIDNAEIKVAEVDGKENKNEENVAKARKYAETLNKVLPEGIKITGIALPVSDRNEIDKAQYEITLTGVSIAALTEFFSKDVINAKKFSKKSGEKIIDIKSYLGDLEINNSGEGIIVKVTLPAGNKLNINTSVLIGALKEYFDNDLQILCEKRIKLMHNSGKEFR